MSAAYPSGWSTLGWIDSYRLRTGGVPLAGIRPDGEQFYWWLSGGRSGTEPTRADAKAEALSTLMGTAGFTPLISSWDWEWWMVQENPNQNRLYNIEIEEE